MQLAPVPSVSPSLPTTRVASPFAAVAALAGAPQSAPSRELAALSAPAAIRSAALGAAGVQAKPVVDFPGIAAGDKFDILKGSKAGIFGVKGTAAIETFTPEQASFHVNASSFGFKVDLTVDVQRIDDEHVRLISHGSGAPDSESIGRVVESRTNYAHFVNEADASEHTIIVHDGKGGITIDTVVPKVGNAHLILGRQV